MSRNVNIQDHYVTRVEGHGDIRVRATDGQLEYVQWHIPEAPRYFEAMMRGRYIEDIQTVACRICGICSFSHSLAALKAVEAAINVQVSEQTHKLRILANYGEQLESHSLHVGYLVAPDLLGVKSVVPLMDSHPEIVKAIVRIHALANEWMELIGGRRTHPVAMRVGGFGKLPTKRQLQELKKRLQGCIADLKTLADVVLSGVSKFPDFWRETEYVGLVNPGEYTFYDGLIKSSDIQKPVPVEQFESVANEYQIPYSTAKWTKWHRESYAVGSLARFNLSQDELQPLAKETAGKLGLQGTCCNPYMNNAAQIVEALQVVEHGIVIIDDLLGTGLKEEIPPKPRPRAGTGVGCVEAPRGILFHKYSFDEQGYCQECNICIPTNQNHANIQKDLEALVPQILDQEEKDIKLLLEMLVRSYDPCISCSTHYLNVEFV